MKLSKKALALGLATSFAFTSHAFAQDGPLLLPSSTEVPATSVIELAEPPSRAADTGHASPQESVQETVQSELIRQRYPDGKIFIERWVIESESGDYENHGSYVEYDPAGNVVVSGSFHQGMREGNWSRLLSADEIKRLGGNLRSGFAGPFTSKASFSNGALNGDWICSDKNGNLLFAWSFEKGKRSGVSSWFDAKGNVVRSISYHDNLAHGPAKLALKKDAPNQEIDFENGRMRERVDTWHPAANGKQSNRTRRALKSQDWFLVPAPVNLLAHDWEHSLVEHARHDPNDRVRHGTTTTYYPNGQRESQGQFLAGKRAGTFIWWYSNGQQRTVGEFSDDVENGNWIWWHANGMKEAAGAFEQGEKVAVWKVWSADGKLVRKAEATPARLASEPATLSR